MSPAHSNEPLIYQPIALPPRRKLERGAPFQWLKEGQRYFRQSRNLSITYGAVFAVIGMIITALGLTKPQFILTFWSGFLLVGPLFAMGLFRIAQLQDQGSQLNFANCVAKVRGNLGSVALFALFLSLIMIAWIRFSTLAAALYIGNVSGSANFLSALSTPDGVGFLLTLFGVGALFAAAMFALTAWSLPLLLDNRTDFATAVATSVKATTEQPIAMLRWGALVAALTVVGMLTFFAAFVFIFPLLGYATWAGYKDLFSND